MAVVKWSSKEKVSFLKILLTMKHNLILYFLNPNFKLLLTLRFK